MKTKRDFIKEIVPNIANFNYCRDKGEINGTLFADIERAMQEYADQQLILSGVSGSFSAKDMENFAAKCMILGNNGKDTKELLKDFCEYDR